MEVRYQLRHSPADASATDRHTVAAGSGPTKSTLAQSVPASRARSVTGVRRGLMVCVVSESTSSGEDAHTMSREGMRFGPYELRGLLGRGGMGEVYTAYDTSKDRVVALKLLPPHLADDPGYKDRFRHESRTAARLAEPHVIPIHDFGEHDGVLFMDMRLVEGADLRAILDRQRRVVCRARGGRPDRSDR